MKTPSDSFENDLQQLDLRELPSQWKGEILAKAHGASRRLFAPPRPLVLALAASWMVILTLALLTPSTPEVQVTQKRAVFAPDSLFALNQQLDLSLP